MRFTRTALDRALGYLNPQWEARRIRARAQTEYLANLGGFESGQSNARRSIRTWQRPTLDADSALIPDRQLLINGSHALYRNNPMAAGAINTLVAHVVGTGLTMHSRIDAEVLGMSDDEADAWQQQTEREWRLFSETREIHLGRTLAFHSYLSMMVRNVALSGDMFTLMTFHKRAGSPYQLKLQEVDALRVSNPAFQLDSPAMRQGVERESTGAPLAFHVHATHPGSMLSTARDDWRRIPAYRADGLPNMLHHFRPLWPDQSRGMPWFSPVLDSLYGLGTLVKAELDAAVVNSFLTVFIKSAKGDLSFPNPTDANIGTQEVALGPAAVIGLAPGEEIDVVDPKRPNSSLDAFFQLFLRLIGSALEIPHEIITKQFQSSYSAARGAFLEAWKAFTSWRAWTVRSLAQPVYEMFLVEAVSLGRITAPGFLTDPLLRKAWSEAEWVGPARGAIEEHKEVEAAKGRVELGVSTKERETAQITGMTFRHVVRQRAKEQAMEREQGLEPNESATPGQPAQPQPVPGRDPVDDEEDGEGEP